MEMMFWNILLTGALALVSFFAKTLWAEVQRLSILLNRTREEMAREFVTKEANTQVLSQIMSKFDRLEEKIDRLMER
jgi:hypothetical protein